MNKVTKKYTYVCNQCGLHAESMVLSEYECEGETTTPDTIGGTPVPKSIIRYCPECDAVTRHWISDTTDQPQA